MGDIVDFFKKLLDTNDWPPRWHCGNWTGFHGWLYIISDLMIWSAYFTIPLIIVRFISRKTNIRFTRIYFLFAAFILACGATHFLDAAAFWIPAYRLNALVRLFTGVISWITVFNIVKALPIAFALKSSNEMERELEKRTLAEKKFRSLLESAPDAMVIVNESGRIQLVNAQTETLFGYSKDEMLDRPVELLMPDRYGDAHVSHRLGYFKTSKVRLMGEGFELFAKKKSGSEFPVEISLSPLETDEGLLVSAAIRDISEKKQLENQIREANVNLEKKVHDRTIELERKNKELEQFAYVASHDLQEPLRTTSSFIELFKEKYLGKSDEETDTILTYIGQANDRMKVLIKDLLDYSRIGRKNVLEEVDCNEILSAVLADLSTSIIETNASIHSEKLPVIKGYPTELTQLFQNLISNSIKFRKANVNPVIAISVKKGPGYWEFSIADNGIGMDKENTERIFVIFQRLHTRSEYEGSGIGLSHCKKIAELHGGKIWVESEPGEGSVFHFTIYEM